MRVHTCDGRDGGPNGTTFLPNSTVTGLEWHDDHYHISISSSDEPVRARFVVNAASVYSDIIHNMIAENAFDMHPTLGEYYLLDRAVGSLVNAIIFRSPTARSKGITVSPTIHYNFLVGQDSELVDDRADTGVTRVVLDEIATKATKMALSIVLRTNVRRFAGIRANSSLNNYFIEISEPNFLDPAAIKSPAV